MEGIGGRVGRKRGQRGKKSKQKITRSMTGVESMERGKRVIFDVYVWVFFPVTRDRVFGSGAERQKSTVLL